MAIEVGLRYPERVKSLILSAPGGMMLASSAIGRTRSVSRDAVENPTFDNVKARLQFAEWSALSERKAERPSIFLGQELARNIGARQSKERSVSANCTDRKVSAVVDGKVVYSEEVIWEPRKQTDPEYHYREIMTALQTAASKMPRVDAVGGSSGSTVGGAGFTRAPPRCRRRRPAP